MTQSDARPGELDIFSVPDLTVKDICNQNQVVLSLRYEKLLYHRAY